MIDNPEILVAAVPRRIARWSGAVVVLVGVLVLVGWISGFPALAGLVGSVTMKANAALCFVLCGAALWLLQTPGRHGARAARVCALIVGGIALLTLAEFATGWNLGIDELIVRDTGPAFGTSHPGRMAPNTALCFALVAAGLWLMSRPARNALRPLILALLGSFVVATGLLAVLGYFSGFTVGYSWGHFNGMAIHTTAVFLLLGTVLLAFAWRATGTRWLIEPWITAWFVTGLALLVAVTAISHRSTKNLGEAADRVKRTHEVLATFGEIRSSLNEHQSAVRGFVLTGNASFLPLAQDTLPHALQHLQELSGLMSDSEARQRRVALLETQIEERRQLVRTAIELRGRGELAEATALFAGGNGKATMDAIRVRLGEVEAEENTLLRDRAAASKASADRTFVLLSIGAVLSLVLLASGMLRLNGVMAAHRRGTDALRKSRELLELAIGAGQLGVWDCDLVTDTMVCDERCKAMAGLPRDAVMSYAVALGTIHPDDRGRIEAAVARSLGTKEDCEVEYRTVWPDGTVRWVQSRGRSFEDAGGKSVRCTGTMMDITGRKLAEQALNESQSRLRLAADVARMAYVEVDLVKGRVRSSVNFEAVMGYAGLPGGIADLTEGSALWLVHIVPEDRAHYASAYRKFLEGQFPEKVEYRSVGDDGIERWIESTTTGDFGPDGTLLRAFIINIDITERKRVDEALRTSEAKERARRMELETLMDAIPAAVFIAHDAACRKMSGSRYTRKMLRIPDGHNVSKSAPIGEAPEFTVWTDGRLLTPEELPVQRAAATGEAVSDVEVQIVFPDGETLDILGNALPLFEDSGVVRGAIGVFMDITGRKRAVRSLRASEERTNLATTATGVGIWERNIASGLIRWDAEMFRIYGLAPTPDGLVPYATWRESVLPEDLAGQEAVLQETVRRGGRSSREFRIRRADDRKLRYLQSVETVRTNAQGQVEWVVGTNLDITDRKQTEMNMALLASLSEDLVRLTSVDGIMQAVGAKVGAYLDLSACTFAEVNEAADQVVVTHEWHRDDARSLLGVYRLDEYLTEEFQKTCRRGELFVVRDTATDPRTDARHLEELKINAFLCVPLLQDGSWRFLMSIYHHEPYDWQDDEIEVMRELTTRVRARIEGIRAEEAVRESEERFHAIADNIPQLAWMADGDGRFVWFNRAWLAYTGTVLEDNLGAGWKAFCHPDFVDGVAERLERHLREGRDWEHTFRLRGKDGAYRWFLSRMNAIRDESGKVVRFFGTNTDVTELRESQTQLAEAHNIIASRAYELEKTVAERTAALRETIEELEGFSYSISHDMRAPLRAMQSFAQILQEECSDRISPQGLDYIRRIVTAADRMDALIRDILTYSRVVRSELPLENVDLAALLTGIVADYPQFEATGADISVVHPIPRVLGNAAALTQCLSNLIGNAVKFVAAGIRPKVEIRAEVRGRRVCLFIRDNGIGIDPQMHEKIFNIFYRMSRDYEGTGIGLAIVRRAAQRMGGHVSLVSEPGKGSTFQLELDGASQE